MDPCLGFPDLVFVKIADFRDGKRFSEQAHTSFPLFAPIQPYFIRRPERCALKALRSDWAGTQIGFFSRKAAETFRSSGLRVLRLFSTLDPLSLPKGRVIPHREETIRRIG